MFDIQVHQNFGKTIHVINFFSPSQPSVQRNFHEGSSPDLATPDEALHKGDNNLTLGEGEREGRPRAFGARVQVRVQVRARSILPSNTVRQLLPSTNIPLSRVLHAGDQHLVARLGRKRENVLTQAGLKITT